MNKIYIEDATIEEFYRKYKGYFFRSDKYPKDLFVITGLKNYKTETKIVCELVKGVKFRPDKVPTLPLSSLKEKGIYIIESFDKGVENL